MYFWMLRVGAAFDTSWRAAGLGVSASLRLPPPPGRGYARSGLAAARERSQSRGKFRTDKLACHFYLPLNTEISRSYNWKSSAPFFATHWFTGWFASARLVQPLPWIWPSASVIGHRPSPRLSRPRAAAMPAAGWERKEDWNFRGPPEV